MVTTSVVAEMTAEGYWCWIGNRWRLLLNGFRWNCCWMAAAGGRCWMAAAGVVAGVATTGDCCWMATAGIFAGLATYGDGCWIGNCTTVSIFWYLSIQIGRTSYIYMTM